MLVTLTLALSLLALMTSFYQAWLQRVHNQKSVKPLPQIDLMDRNGLLYIHVQNNGVGPLIVDKLIFTIAGKRYYRIQDCLNLDPKGYHHIEVTDTNKKVVIPGSFLLVFSEEFDPASHEETMEEFRKELSKLDLKVEARDIYDNKITVEKSLKWFVRHA